MALRPPGWHSCLTRLYGLWGCGLRGWFPARGPGFYVCSVGVPRLSLLGMIILSVIVCVHKLWGSDGWHFLCTYLYIYIIYIYMYAYTFCLGAHASQCMLISTACRAPDGFRRAPGDGSNSYLCLHTDSIGCHNSGVYMVGFFRFVGAFPHNCICTYALDEL